MGLKESLMERVSGGDFKKKEEALQPDVPTEDDFSGGFDLSSSLESPVSSDGFSLESLADNSNYDDDGLEISQDFNPLEQAMNEARQEEMQSAFEYGGQRQQMSIDQVFQQQMGQSMPSSMNDRYPHQFDYQQNDNSQQYEQMQYNQSGFDVQQLQQSDYSQQQMYNNQQPVQQQNPGMSSYQDPVQQMGYQQPQQYQQPTQQYGMQDYAPQQNQVIPEPAPATYGMNDNPSYGVDSSVNEVLEDNLLSLAKKVVLEDVTKTFESTLINKEALSKLIDSYLNNSQSPYTNGKAILTSVIDEILASDYSEAHYGELVPMILSSVKADLN